MAKDTFVRIRFLKRPTLREISFSGNMPSPYEKKFKSDIKKTLKKELKERKKK